MEYQKPVSVQWLIASSTVPRGQLVAAIVDGKILPFVLLDVGATVNAKTIPRPSGKVAWGKIQYLPSALLLPTRWCIVSLMAGSFMACALPWPHLIRLLALGRNDDVIYCQKQKDIQPLKAILDETASQGSRDRTLQAAARFHQREQLLKVRVAISRPKCTAAHQK